MTNREAQNELCRATKTPEEAYRIALSYERGDKKAKTYVTTAGCGTQIKTEPVGAIRGGYRSSRGRGSGQTQGRGPHGGHKRGRRRLRQTRTAGKLGTSNGPVWPRKTVGEVLRPEIFRGKLARNDSNRNKRRTKNPNTKASWGWVSTATKKQNQLITAIEKRNRSWDFDSSGGGGTKW